jgi:hypothetical protein
MTSKALPESVGPLMFQTKVLKKYDFRPQFRINSGLFKQTAGPFRLPKRQFNWQRQKFPAL